MSASSTSTPRYRTVLSIFVCPRQDLNGSQVARLLVDDRRLRPAQRVGAVILATQADAAHPLVDKSRVPPRAYVSRRMGPARKGQIRRECRDGIQAMSACSHEP